MTILEYDDPNTSPENGNGCLKPKSDSDTVQTMKRKRVASKDKSYRPPKPATVKSGTPKPAMVKSGQPDDEINFHIRGQSPSRDEGGIVPQNSNSEVHNFSDVVNPSEDDFAWILQTATQHFSLGCEEEEAKATSECNQAEERQLDCLEPVTHTASLRQTVPDTVPATPIKQVGDVAPSPQTEEIRRERIPTSPESVSSSPRPTAGSSSTKDTVLEAVHTIQQFSKHRHGIPREVHSRIIRTLRKDHEETSSTSNLAGWSDGATWMRVLESGESEKQKATIFSLLGYMGASEWYESQVNLSQAILRTKKNGPVKRRGAATHVMNELQGKWIKGVGNLSLGREGDGIGVDPERYDTGLSERALHLQRKRIGMQLSRGYKLNTKLVKDLGLGILFDPKVW